MIKNELLAFFTVLCALTSTCKNRVSSTAYADTSGEVAMDVKSFTLDPLPSWARDGLYSGSYLDIDKMSSAFGFSRFEAIEVQNRMRDFQEADPTSVPQETFAKAVGEIREKNYESGWSPITFTKPEEFVAVFDMDETLLVQWHATSGQGFSDLFHVLSDFVGDKRSPDSVKFTPGAEDIIKRLKANPSCRALVAFSAKADAPMIDILNKWKFGDGEPARKYFSGVFTRNHLIIGPKILIPSKDLRIFDPELKHVVMIDDNPGRIFQPMLLRAEPKFDADTYFHAKSNAQADIIIHYETMLGHAAEEIEETAKAAAALNIPFSQAFIPYSYAGNRIYQNYIALGKDASEARRLARMAPQLNDAAFVPMAAPAIQP